MTTATNTAILDGRGHGLGADALAAWVRDFVGKAGEVYSYSEALSDCALVHTSLDAWTPPDDGFEGRVFSADAEVRWRTTADGTFDAWGLREVSPGTNGATNVTRVTRHYYLVGRGTKQPGKFEEARYPGKVFDYPVSTNWDDADAANGRAFIEVAEYSPVEPADWAGLAATVESEGVVAALNQPRLVAHRFVAVGADKGGQ